MRSLLSKPHLVFLGDHAQRMLVPACLKCVRVRRKQFITVLLELQRVNLLYSDSTQRTGLESHALIFCALHFHINLLEYLSSTFAEIIKALADPCSQYEEGGGERGGIKWRGGKLSETAAETYLRHLTFAEGYSTVSRLSSPLFALWWGLLAGLGLGWGLPSSRWLTWLLVLVQWLLRRPSWFDEIISSLF